MHTKPVLAAVIPVAGIFTFMWVSPGERKTVTKISYFTRLRSLSAVAFKILEA